MPDILYHIPPSLSRDAFADVPPFSLPYRFCFLSFSRKNRGQALAFSRPSVYNRRQKFRKKGDLPVSTPLCTQCPRACAVSRETGERGYCGAPAQFLLARAARHPFEEPCISGTRGSGTVFFSGCSLGCVYCQNAEISGGISPKYSSQAKIILSNVLKSTSYPPVEENLRALFTPKYLLKEERFTEFISSIATVSFFLNALSLQSAFTVSSSEQYTNKVFKSTPHIS